MLVAAPYMTMLVSHEYPVNGLGGAGDGARGNGDGGGGEGVTAGYGV